MHQLINEFLLENIMPGFRKTFSRIYLTEDIIVKATWREARERVTVTYNANNGYFPLYSYDDLWITSWDIPDQEIDKYYYVDFDTPWLDDDHRFAGWSLNPDDEDAEWGYSYDLKEDTTFYAIYIPYSERPYKFLYDANGGEIYDENIGNTEDAHWVDSRVDYPYLGRYWIKNYGLRRDGYEFMGWASTQENADAGIVDYEVDDKLIISDDVTIYAVWHKYPTITYHANGSNWEIYEWDEEKGEDVLVGTRDTEVHYGDAGRYYHVGCWIENSYTEHINNGTEEGLDIEYEFMGWYDAETGGKCVDNIEIMLEDGDDLHYYAHWRKQITVHYVSDISKGGWWNDDTKDHDIASIDRGAWAGDVYDIDGWNPDSPDGYWDFVGYSVAPNATEAEYLPNERVLLTYDNIDSTPLAIQTLLVSDKTEDVYLYAVWKKNPIARYHDGDGENADFSSWPNGDNGYREHILSAGYHYYFGEEFPEMGHWEARHWIMYDDNGEPVIMDDEMIVPSYGDEYDLYPDWVKVIGITYDANGGLFLDENGNEAWNSESGETSGEVHYRNQRQDDEEWLDGWRPNKVEYEYGDNGEVTNEIHYEFVGWSKDPDFVFDSSLTDPYAELIRDEDYKMLSDYGEAGTADDAVTFPELEEGFFITLYAVYAPKLTIIYDANGGGWNWDGTNYEKIVRVQDHNYGEDTYYVGEWWPDRYQYPYNQETGEFADTPVQYRFIGWSLDRNATDAATDWEIDLASRGTVRVYAIWAQPIQIPIDFAGGQFCYDYDDNDDPLYSDSTTMYQIEGDYITSYDLNRNYYPEKEGCEFIGWSVGYTNDNGSGNGSENGSENNDPVIFVPVYNGVRVRPGMIIRAEWVDYDYPEVHLALDGGVLWGDDTGDENGVIILTPSNRGAYRYSGVLYPGEIGIPNKPGYHFAGWRTDTGVFPSKITVTQDISLYATWIEDPDYDENLFAPEYSDFVVFKDGSTPMNIYYNGGPRNIIYESENPDIAYVTAENSSYYRILVHGKEIGSTVIHASDEDGNTFSINVMVTDIQLTADKEVAVVGDYIHFLWEGDLLSQNVNVCWYESASTLVCESLKSEGFPNDGWDAIYKVVGSGKTEVGVCVNGYSYKTITIYTFEDEDYFGAEENDIKLLCWDTGGQSTYVKIFYPGEERTLEAFSYTYGGYHYVDSRDKRLIYIGSPTKYNLKSSGIPVSDRMGHKVTINVEPYYLTGVNWRGSITSGNGRNITVKRGTTIKLMVNCIGPDNTPYEPSWFTECPGIVSFANNRIGEGENAYEADFTANRVGTVTVGAFIPGSNYAAVHTVTITVIDDSGDDPYA